MTSSSHMSTVGGASVVPSAVHTGLSGLTEVSMPVSTDEEWVVKKSKSRAGMYYRYNAYTKQTEWLAPGTFKRLPALAALPPRSQSALCFMSSSTLAGIEDARLMTQSPSHNTCHGPDEISQYKEDYVEKHSQREIHRKKKEQWQGFTEADVEEYASHYTRQYKPIPNPRPRTSFKPAQPPRPEKIKFEGKTHTQEQFQLKKGDVKIVRRPISPLRVLPEMAQWDPRTTMQEAFINHGVVERPARIIPTQRRLPRNDFHGGTQYLDDFPVRELAVHKKDKIVHGKYVYGPARNWDTAHKDAYTLNTTTTTPKKGPKAQPHIQSVD